MPETTKLAEQIARDLLNRIIRPMHERGRALEIHVADMRDVIEGHLAGDPEGPTTVLNDSSAPDFMTIAARRCCRDVPALKAITVLYAWDFGGNDSPAHDLASWVTEEGPGGTDCEAVTLTLEQVLRFYQHAMGALNKHTAVAHQALLSLQQQVKERARDDKEIKSAEGAKEFTRIFKEVGAEADRQRKVKSGAGDGSNEAPIVSGD